MRPEMRAVGVHQGQGAGSGPEEDGLLALEPAGLHFSRGECRGEAEAVPAVRVAGEEVGILNAQVIFA
jgi:hypothetical protein